MFEKANYFLKSPEDYEKTAHLFYKFIEINFKNYTNLIAKNNIS
jgi:hypothetical protein